MTIYDFTVKDNKGQSVSLDKYHGQVILVVNTASECGFTPQLGPLQKLYEDYRDQGLVVLAFPSNQFGGQEPDSDDHIERFYHDTYGVTFPIMAKTDVNGPESEPLYIWMRQEISGLLGGAIKWNFTKFLVNRKGEVVSRHAPSVEPDKLRPEIECLLAETA